MIFRRKVLLMTFTILPGLLLTSSSYSVEKESNYASDRRFLLVVSSSFLNCPLCLTSFMKFIEEVNAEEMEKSFIGVLTIDRAPNESISEKKVKIIEKQLRGFIFGNNINFPFILDKDGLFNDLSLDDTILVLFDVQKKLIKKYQFPLNKKQLEEIFEGKE